MKCVIVVLAIPIFGNYEGFLRNNHIASFPHGGVRQAAMTVQLDCLQMPGASEARQPLGGTLPTFETNLFHIKSAEN